MIKIFIQNVNIKLNDLLFLHLNILVMPENENIIETDLYKKIEVEDEDIGSAIMEDPFNPSEINIIPKSPTISLLVKRMSAKNPEIDLFPEFQRSDDLWSVQKQSQLIESILISFPLPAFYFDGTDDDKWLVVDGLQRLSSIRNFVIDKTLRLTGLEFLEDLEGESFDGLPRSLQRKIEETQIIAYIIQPGTPTKVKYNIFKRINTGGLVLTPQEIRHALNQGIPAKFIADLANIKEFKKATEYRINTTRMLDREFVTRFIAFYLNEPNSYVPDLDSFLNKSMGQITSLTKEERQKIKSDFTDSMDLAYSIFNRWAFRKADLFPDRRKPINKALFEVWAVNLAKLPESKRNIVEKKKKEVLNRFVEMMKNDPKFVDSITSGTGGRQQVITRFEMIKQLLKNICHD